MGSQRVRHDWEIEQQRPDSEERYRFYNWLTSKSDGLVAAVTLTEKIEKSYIFKKIFNFFQYLTSLYFCYLGRADLHIGFVFLMPAKLSNHFADEGMDISRN